MDYMFEGYCFQSTNNPVRLDISNWKFGKLASAKGMFKNYGAQNSALIEGPCLTF